VAKVWNYKHTEQMITEIQRRQQKEYFEATALQCLLQKEEEYIKMCKPPQKLLHSNLTLSFLPTLTKHVTNKNLTYEGK